MGYDKSQNCYQCNKSLPQSESSEDLFSCGCGIEYLANYGKWLPAPTIFKHFRGQ